MSDSFTGAMPQLSVIAVNAEDKIHRLTWSRLMLTKTGAHLDYLSEAIVEIVQKITIRRVPTVTQQTKYSPFTSSVWHTAKYVFNGRSDTIQQMVKVIWQKGRIAAAHGRFTRIRQLAPMCALSNMWILGSTQVHIHRRHLDRFSRFCTAHGRKFLYFTMGRPFPGSGTHLIHGSLGPPKSKT